jgi:hypothetical protein
LAIVYEESPNLCEESARVVKESPWVDEVLAFVDKESPFVCEETARVVEESSRVEEQTEKFL